MIAVLLAGCITPDDHPQRSSAQRLLLEVTTESSLLSRGETLHIQLTVTNESDVEAVKHFTSGCIYGFSLWNDQGELVAPPPPICTADAPTVKYAPGEVVIREFQWMWDDSEIKPGTYLLVAGFGPRGEQGPATSVEIRLQ
jgi:hypothetical protein